MKNAVLLLLALVGLTGCVVVPADPVVVGGPPGVYAAPPPVVVVPGRPYYHRHGYWGHPRGHGYWGHPHRRYWH